MFSEHVAWITEQKKFTNRNGPLMNSPAKENMAISFERMHDILAKCGIFLTKYLKIHQRKLEEDNV